MTDERKKAFAEIAFKDEENAKKYLAMSPEDVAEDFKKNGYDYTVEEIKALGDEIMEAKKKKGTGELSVEDLDNVAGGSWWSDFGGGVLAGLATVGVGFILGW